MSLFKKKPTRKVTVQVSARNVKLQVTSVHEGRRAPEGQVFYLLSVKIGNQLYKARYSLNRSSLDYEAEKRFQDKQKEDFFNDVITKYKL